jgi:hypothetical protein
LAGLAVSHIYATATGIKVVNWVSSRAFIGCPRLIAVVFVGKLNTATVAVVYA